MPCQIGVTSDPDAKREYCSKIYKTFSEWKILETFEDLAEAREAQNKHIKETGCAKSSFEESDDGSFKRKWHVYFFFHGKKPRLESYSGLKRVKK